MESLKSIYNNMSDMSKLLLKMLLGITCALLVLFFIVLILRTVRGGNNSDNRYVKLENTMQKAAQKYYKENKSALPEIGEEKEISTSELTSMEYMKEIEKYVGKDDKCTGTVTVINNNNYYAYVPSLDCGEKYATKFLTDEIIEANDINDDEGSGLQIDEEDNMIFKGEYVNNYLSFAGLDFRILRINNDDTIRVLLATPLKNYKSSRWDDRYNVEKNANVGINDYKVSRIREELSEIYNDETIFSESAKSFIATQTLCIGARSEDSTDLSDAQECSETLEDEYIGLIQVNEYLLASADENCKSVASISCSNYNYLANIGKSYWTITPFTEDTYHNFRISRTPSVARTSSVSNLLITLNLSAKTTLEKGSGTQEDPFVVKLAKD